MHRTAKHFVRNNGDSRFCFAKLSECARVFASLWRTMAQALFRCPETIGAQLTLLKIRKDW